MTPVCHYLHGSDYTCLLRRLDPKLTCPERLKGDNCRLAKEERK